MKDFITKIVKGDFKYESVSINSDTEIEIIEDVIDSFVEFINGYTISAINESYRSKNKNVTVDNTINLKNFGIEINDEKSLKQHGLYKIDVKYVDENFIHNIENCNIYIYINGITQQNDFIPFIVFLFDNFYISLKCNNFKENIEDVKKLSVYLYLITKCALNNSYDVPKLIHADIGISNFIDNNDTDFYLEDGKSLKELNDQYEFETEIDTLIKINRKASYTNKNNNIEDATINIDVESFEKEIYEYININEKRLDINKEDINSILYNAGSKTLKNIEQIMLSETIKYLEVVSSMNKAKKNKYVKKIDNNIFYIDFTFSKVSVTKELCFDLLEFDKVINVLKSNKEELSKYITLLLLSINDNLHEQLFHMIVEITQENNNRKKSIEDIVAYYNNQLNNIYDAAVVNSEVLALIESLNLNNSRIDTLIHLVFPGVTYTHCGIQSYMNDISKSINSIMYKKI